MAPAPLPNHLQPLAEARADYFGPLKISPFHPAQRPPAAHSRKNSQTSHTQTHTLSKPETNSDWRQQSAGTPDTAASAHNQPAASTKVQAEAKPAPAGTSPWNWWKKAGNLAIKVPTAATAATRPQKEDDTNQADAKVVKAPPIAIKRDEVVTRPERLSDAKMSIRERRRSRQEYEDRHSRDSHEDERSYGNDTRHSHDKSGRDERSHSGIDARDRNGHARSAYRSNDHERTPSTGSSVVDAWGPGGLRFDDGRNVYQSPPLDFNIGRPPWQKQGRNDASDDRSPSPITPYRSQRNHSGLKPLTLVPGSASGSDQDHNRMDEPRRRAPRQEDRDRYIDREPVRAPNRDRSRERQTSPVRSRPPSRDRSIRQSSYPQDVEEGEDEEDMYEPRQASTSQRLPSRQIEVRPPSPAEPRTKAAGRRPPSDIPESPSRTSRRFTRPSERWDSRADTGSRPTGDNLRPNTYAKKQPSSSGDGQAHKGNTKIGTSDPRGANKQDVRSLPKLQTNVASDAPRATSATSSPEDETDSPGVSDLHGVAQTRAQTSAQGAAQNTHRMKVQKAASGPRPTKVPHVIGGGKGPLHVRKPSFNSRKRDVEPTVSPPVEVPIARPGKPLHPPAPSGSRAGAAGNTQAAVGGAFARAAMAARRQMSTGPRGISPVNEEEQASNSCRRQDQTGQRHVVKRSSLSSLTEFVPAELPAAQMGRRQSILQRQKGIRRPASPVGKRDSYSEEIDVVFIERVILGALDISSPNRKGSQLVMRALPADSQLVIEWKQENKSVLTLSFDALTSVQLPGPECPYNFILLKPSTGDIRNILLELDRAMLLHFQRFFLILVGGAGVSIEHLSTSAFEKLVRDNEW